MIPKEMTRLVNAGSVHGRSLATVTLWPSTEGILGEEEESSLRHTSSAAGGGQDLLTRANQTTDHISQGYRAGRSPKESLDHLTYHVVAILLHVLLTKIL